MLLSTTQNPKVLASVANVPVEVAREALKRGEKNSVTCNIRFFSSTVARHLTSTILMQTMEQLAYDSITDSFRSSIATL